MAAYLLGLVTLPALYVVTRILLNVLGVVTGFIASFGWFIEFGGEDPSDAGWHQWERSYGHRRVVRRGPFWVGDYLNKGVSRSRFVTLGTGRFGVCIGRRRLIGDGRTPVMPLTDDFKRRFPEKGGA